MSNSNFKSNVEALRRHYGSHTAVAAALGYTVTGWRAARRNGSQKAAKLAEMAVAAIQAAAQGEVCRFLDSAAKSP